MVEKIDLVWGEAKEVAKKKFDKPMIVLFDTDESVNDALMDSGFSIQDASLGVCVNVPNKRCDNQYFLHLNSHHPENIHEFDVVIVDMTCEKIIEYSNEIFDISKTRGNEALALLSRYPQTIFDPRPLASKWLSKEINQILKRQSLIVVFCEHEITSTYEIVEISSKSSRVRESESASIFNFYSQFPRRKPKRGKKVEVSPNDYSISAILSKYLEGVTYGSIFEHPTQRMIVNGEFSDVKLENFIPLLVNADNEIVSFCNLVENGAVFVFPNIVNKAAFVSDLCNSFFPEMFPELFPHHGEFGWLTSEDYLLPKEAELYQQKADIQRKYEQDIQNKNKEIERNKTQYQFLHEMIYQTGDELVKSVELFMKWLGFDAVRNMDETNPAIREEDLQIDTSKGLLVVEVKGIGGRSKDHECSQISKIKLRRVMGLQRFDVFGLYIVNHQRYMPPKARANPPFTEHQLADARHDARGLLTTYQLYKAYFLIEQGLLTKEDVRESLLTFGLISFEPKNLVSLGQVIDWYAKPKSAVINLDGQITLVKGQRLFFKKDGDIYPTEVESIRLSDVDVDSASSGEIGLKLSCSVKKDWELFAVHSPSS